ncbi:MAG: MFS transporter [Pseudomonadales bacterium]|nr:MFS transporter [Pseudomonadales bacterium]
MSSNSAQRFFTRGALAPLANREYRFLLAGFAIGQMLMPLQFITQILWVQQFAPQDIWLILVALIATCRGIGAMMFGLYGGALADRYDRKRLLLLILVLQLVGTVMIAALMYFMNGGVLGFSLFFLLTFLTSGLQSIDAPTRMALLPDVLGPELTPAGMSLNQVAGQLAMPVAMVSTGIIIDQLGFSGAYLCSAIALVVAMGFIYLMRYQPSETQLLQAGKRYGLGEVFTDVKVGLAYARNHSVIFWLIMLLILMMSFGYPATASFGPTWVTTVVEVEIRNMGFVVMFWGLGSFVAAIVMTRLASFERRGALVAFGAVLFSLSFVVFVSDHTVLNVIIGNFGLGAGMTTTMVSSTILIQHLAPNEVRGRIMSIFQLNMAFAQLMTMPVAFLGQWLTLPVLFPILSWITLGMVILILLSRPQVAKASVS